MSSDVPSTPIQYRQAQRVDIPRMAAIWAIEGNEGGTSEERMTAYFDGHLHPQHALAPRTIYVAHEAEAVIGYIAGHLTRRVACDGELEWLYVVPQRRRSGVASGLMPCLAAWFKEQKASRVCVNVARSNTAAHSFYARHGAEPMNQYWLVWDNFAAAIEKSMRTLSTRTAGDLK
jgi:GNAT superfamily N-acetyltransferase